MIANKIENKAFRMYRTTVKRKAVQSLTHNLSSPTLGCIYGICIHLFMVFVEKYFFIYTFFPS